MCRGGLVVVGAACVRYPHTFGAGQFLLADVDNNTRLTAGRSM